MTLFAKIEHLVVNQKISLVEGVRRLVDSIPSKKYPEVLAYYRRKEIRPGFAELLDYLHFQGIPFVVISGGLIGSVQTRLADFQERIHAIYAAEINTEGNYLKVYSSFENDGEMVDKTSVMNRYHFDEAVAIGDGITDLNMALMADVIFARDNLSQYLAEKRKSFIRWKVEIPGNPLSKTWEDKALWESWINYYSCRKEKKGLCYVTGVDEFIADNSLSITDESNADIIITGIINSISQRAASVTGGETVEEYHIYVSVRVKCEDIKSNKALWEKTFNEYGSMDAGTADDTEREAAILVAMEKITENILNNTLGYW